MRELTLLQGAIDHYKKKLGLVNNPVSRENVERPVVNDERNVRLEADQIRALVAECYRARNRWLGPLVECAFEIGARRGNLLRLQWPDVHLNEKFATLRDVKNSRKPDEIIDEDVSLSPRAIEILKALPRTEGDSRVFPMTKGSLKSGFEHARRRKHLEHFRLHDARHERTSNLIEAGWSDSKVMAQTGHKDPKSLLRYRNLRKRFLGKALEELDAIRAFEISPETREKILLNMDPQMMATLMDLIEKAKLLAAQKKNDACNGE